MIAILLMAGLMGMAVPAGDTGDASPPLSGEATREMRWQLDHIAGRWVTLGRTVDGQQFMADFIRADVDIQPSIADRVEIKVEAVQEDTDLPRIVLQVNWSDEAVRAVDLFPRRSSRMNEECLPPSDDRGDFWVTATHLKVTLRLPRRMKAQVHVREGRVKDMRPAHPE